MALRHTKRGESLKWIGAMFVDEEQRPRPMRRARRYPFAVHIELVLGRVIYVNRIVIMGIAFTQVEEKDQATLEKWISELREHK
jgi:hypothetical protein